MNMNKIELKRAVKLTDNQKNYANKKWYREKIDEFAQLHSNLIYIRPIGDTDLSRYAAIKINEDLYNNKLHYKDFKSVLNPYGKKIAEVPKDVRHNDIISPKMNAVVGLELTRPFKWRVYAVNPEATTRIEQEETKRLQRFVYNQIMAPILKQIELEKAQAEKGRELSDEERQQIEAQLDQKLQTMTPEEVKRYMKRDHQDPAEVLAKHILNYEIQNQNIEYKFMLGLLDLIRTNSVIFYVGAVNDNLKVSVIDPKKFTTDYKANKFIQDNDWAVVEYRMTYGEILEHFSDVLTDKELQKIKDDYDNYTSSSDLFALSMFDDEELYNKIRVLHVVWKDLRKIQILTYHENKNIFKKIVSDDYELNPEAGDIDLKEKWITEVYEGWLIGDDIYTNMRPVPSQIKDIDNLHDAKLPYYGIINPIEASLLSRAKNFAYLYDAAIFHVEKLMASDKGKKIFANIKTVPEVYKLKEWIQDIDVSPVSFFDPSQEGSGYNDINTSMKVVDLSLVSDITKYIEIAKFARDQIGIITGITDELEGKMSPYMTATNAKQSVALSSNILEITLKLFNFIKKEVLTAIIETSKIVYRDKDKLKLSYIMDDMSKNYFTIDSSLLRESTYGIFLENAGEAEKLRETIKQLAHAAMQNQAIEFSDALKVLREDGIVENIEMLEQSEEKRREYEQQKIEQERQIQQEALKKEEELQDKKHKQTLEQIITKEEERRKTELMKAQLLGASFNPDLDKNDNGVNDFIDMYNKEKELALKDKELSLKEKEIDKKYKLEEKKLNQQKNK